MGITEPTDGLEVIYLRPEKIQVDERFNVRPYSDQDPDIDQLAESIERDGQLDAGIVYPVTKKGLNASDTPDEYVLIAGHRRRRALIINNETRSRSGQPLLKMRVTIDRSGGDHLRKAISSNLHRSDFSPMDLATLITRIMADNGWDKQDFASSKKVAKYLGVSPTQITQHLRFLKAPKEIQEKLHSGELSAQSAFDLLSVSQEKREQVLNLAAEIQAQTDESKGKASKSSKGAPQIVVPPSSNKSESTPSKKRIERPAVVKAIRTLGDDESASPIPRTRKEIVEFFASLDGPAYGHVDSQVRTFVAYFTEKWVQGKGTDKTLLSKFDAMVAGSDKGNKPDKVEEPKSKAAPKTKAKPKLDPVEYTPESETAPELEEVVA